MGHDEIYWGNKNFSLIELIILLQAIIVLLSLYKVSVTIDTLLLHRSTTVHRHPNTMMFEYMIEQNGNTRY